MDSLLVQFIVAAVCLIIGLKFLWTIIKILVMFTPLLLGVYLISNGFGKDSMIAGVVCIVIGIPWLFSSLKK